MRIRWSRLLALAVLLATPALQAAAQTPPNAFSSAVGGGPTPGTGHAAGGITANGVFDGNYRYDDGTSEQSVGMTRGGDILWLVAFEAQAGFETISSISVAWGATVGTANLVAGTPARVFIYEDPNDDGDPSDAVKLLEAATTIQSPHTNTLVVIPVTPTAVSGWFFIGAAYAHAAGQFPGALDQSSPNQGRAWAVGSNTNLDVDNLLNNTIAPVNMSGVFPGNWLLRAYGGPAVNDTDGDGVADDADLCPRTTIPESVPRVSLEEGRYALVNRNFRFDTMTGGVLSPAPRGVNTTATGGCSCEQIVRRTGAGTRQMKYGCGRALMNMWINSVSSAGKGFGADGFMFGAFEDLDDEISTSDLPTSFDLEGNYPNPFNPSTTIRFDVPEAAPVRLSVFNVMGQEVRVLVQGTLEAGRHEAGFDAEGLPSGTYLYRLTTPTGVHSRTMVLLK